MQEPSRRQFLAAIGTGTIGAGVVPTGSSNRPTPRLEVTIHPDQSFGSSTTRDVRSAVEYGVEQVASNVTSRLGLDVEKSVREGIAVPPDAVSTADQPRLFDDVKSWLISRDAYEDGVCHLYLPNAPFARKIGYGSVLSHVANGGTIAFANLGATQKWEDPAVSANIAIHEWLHTVIRPGIAEEVNGSRCEHDLGAVIKSGLGTVDVTPMATTYADKSLFGSETQWDGTGCWNHDSFFRHDGQFLVPLRWKHTPDLSKATLQAATRYVEKYLA